MKRNVPSVERASNPDSLTVDRGKHSNHSGTIRLIIIVVVVIGLYLFVPALLTAIRLPAAIPDNVASLLEKLFEKAPVKNTIPASTARSSTALQRLQLAVKSSDQAAITLALTSLSKNEINTPTAGMTALMTASSIGDANTLMLLLDAGADPNARGSHQRTALQYAAEKNHLAAATALLDAGADINGVDDGSLSPLIMAADRNFTELAMLLIERKAKVNIQTVDGWTALMDAVQADNSVLVKALLEAGAITQAKHSNGATALSIAQHGNNTTLINLLSAGDRPFSPLPRTKPHSQKKASRQ